MKKSIKKGLSLILALSVVFTSLVFAMPLNANAASVGYTIADSDSNIIINSATRDRTQSYNFQIYLSCNNSERDGCDDFFNDAENTSIDITYKAFKSDGGLQENVCTISGTDL